MRRRAVRSTLAATALLAVGVAHGSCTGSLIVPPLSRCDAPLPVDDQLEVARRFAPWILNEVHPSGGRQDLPTRADFDGNLRGDDDWENLPRFALPPVVYYAVVESETHWFVAYHLFHPRDWSPIDLGLHMTHENDGENLQVVVDKASGRVVLLFTQAHYRGEAHADADSGFAAGSEPIRGSFLRVDDRGEPDDAGTHVVVRVECCGHGIEASATVGGDGLQLRPAAPDEPVAEPLLDETAPVPYALASTIASFWAGVRDGSLVGEGGLFDGSLRLSTPELVVDVPRYYEADRFSGPFGPDRGISPFAVDFRFGEGEVGALFFDPARRYERCLRVPRPWSTAYLDYPFVSDRNRSRDVGDPSTLDGASSAPTR